MVRLPEVECHRCGQVLASAEFKPKKGRMAPHGTTFEACFRRCDRCGHAYSNSNTGDLNRLTVIYRELFREVPPEIVEGCELILANALNVRNRKSKRRKFLSSNSEDHATWTVFRFIQLAERLGDILRNLGACIGGPSQHSPAVLFWGVPLPSGDHRAVGLQEQLIGTLDALGEGRQSRSEPDLIVDFGAAGLVFIEVKLRSANDRLDGADPKWDRYILNTRAFADAPGVRATGLYELARNWRIAWDIANGRPLTLMNLDSPELFDGKKKSILDEFQKCLRLSDHHRFVRCTWRELFKLLPSLPDWLRAYDEDRSISIGRMRRDLVAPIVGPVSVGEVIDRLTRTHDYLVKHGAAAMQRAGEACLADQWGAHVKRERVLLPQQGRPGDIPVG